MKNALNHLGLLLTLLLYLSAQAVPAQSGAPKDVDYCALFDSPKFADQNVRTTTIMFVPKITGNVVDGPSPFFYSPGCNDRDHFAVANFSLNEDASWAKKVQKDLVPNGPELFYSVTLEGKFLIADEPLFGHLNYARAELKVIDVVSIERILNQSAPNWDADSPIYNTGRSLNSTSTNLLLDLASGKITDQAWIETGSAKVTIERKSASLDDVVKFLRTRAGNNPLEKSAGARISRSGTHWFARGSLIFSFAGRANIVFQYESEYLQIESQPWKLLSLDIGVKK